VAREFDDPLGHLRQGLGWQDDLDARARLSARQARLKELDVLGLITRFRAKRPPQRALDELDTILLKLREAIDVNLGYPPRLGHPQSQWEQEALQELQRFTGEAPVEQPPSVERPFLPAARPPPPRPVRRPSLPLVKRSPPSPKRLAQSPRESGVAPPPHREGGEIQRVASRPVEQTAPARPKKPTSTQSKELVAFAKKKWGGLEAIPGRDVTKPVLDAKFGRPVAREDYRAIMNEVIPSKERKGGRPKNPAK
jgi:hypothetical protein